MTKLEKAQICDNFLLRFKGNVSVFWNDLRNEYSLRMEDYYVLENNVNFLVGEGLIVRYLDLENGHGLSLTDKGFAIMTDLENLGYLSKERASIDAARKTQRQECINRAIQIFILIISLIGLIIALIK